MKNRIFIGIIAGLIIASNSVISGQKLSVETVIDSNRITLGDQINLSYIIDKRNDLPLKLPALSDTLIRGIELIGKPEIDSAKIDNENRRITIELLITSFDTGFYYIPPQPVIVFDEYETYTVYTEPTYLEVIGVPIDTTNTVRDIKSVEKVPVTIGEVMQYLIPALILAAIIYFAVIYFIRKKKNKPIFKPAKPEEPAYITALRELDKIKAQKLWQQKQLKEYYTRITYVVRWYIEKRFSFNALEQTSDEILEKVHSCSVDDINYSNLAQLLNLADLVKFAKGEPNPEENIVHLENAYDFIKKTKVEISDEVSDKPVVE